MTYFKGSSFSQFFLTIEDYVNMLHFWSITFAISVSIGPVHHLLASLPVSDLFLDKSIQIQLNTNCSSIKY